MLESDQLRIDPRRYELQSSFLYPAVGLAVATPSAVANGDLLSTSLDLAATRDRVDRSPSPSLSPTSRPGSIILRRCRGIIHGRRCQRSAPGKLAVTSSYRSRDSKSRTRLSGFGRTVDSWDIDAVAKLLCITHHGIGLPTEFYERRCAHTTPLIIPGR